MSRLDRIARWYPPDQRDNNGAFGRMIRSMVTSASRVLDAGAGAGEKFRHDLKGRVAEVVGVDLDPRVLQNPQVDRGIVADLTNIPVTDGYFDAAFCMYVLEHIDEPERFLAEMARVLKPGGCFLFCTPNKHHYVSLAARLTPQFFHRWYNNRRGRDTGDTFPTVYKMNTRSALRRLFSRAGFVERELVLRECAPNYLSFAAVPFFCGLAYERIVNRFECLMCFRVNILGCFVKAD